MVELKGLRENKDVVYSHHYVTEDENEKVEAEKPPHFFYISGVVRNNINNRIAITKRFKIMGWL